MAGCGLWEEWQDVARGTILGTHALGLLFRAARGSQLSGVSEEATFPLGPGPVPPVLHRSLSLVMPLEPATLDKLGEGQPWRFAAPSGPPWRVWLAVTSVFLCPGSESQSWDDNLNLSVHLVWRERELCIWREEAESEDSSLIPIQLGLWLRD